jgi:hypothetical protein
MNSFRIESVLISLRKIALFIIYRPGQGRKEFPMNTGKTLSVSILIFLLLGFSQSMRAEDITPQIGTWVINEEANGAPGRGFQIEFQNDVLVLYFYGYEPTGKSAFWLATGKFQPGSNEITADLGEYQGGMAFGDAMQNAIYLRSVGKVTIRFNGWNQGEICLPDEPCKVITAFNYGYDTNSSSALLGRWQVTAMRFTNKQRIALAITLSKLNQSSDPAVRDSVSGIAQYNVDGVDKVANVVCWMPVEPPPPPYSYSCTIDMTEGDIESVDVLMVRDWMVGKSNVGKDGWFNAYRTRSASGREVIPK